MTALGVDLMELPTANEGYGEDWQPDPAAHLLSLGGEVERITAPLAAEAVASRCGAALSDGGSGRGGYGGVA